MWYWMRKAEDSRSQILPTAALMMLVLIGAVGLAIDAGRLFVARAELVRAVDAAALAGSLELPDLPAAQTKVNSYMAQNEPDAHVDPLTSPSERQIEVHGTKSVDVVFMRIFGIDSVDVNATATAGFGILAVDTVMAVDRTLSMSGDPLTQAKIAAKNFTDVLLGTGLSSSDTQVGVAPYSNCYQPPWIPTPTPAHSHGHDSTTDYCTPASMVVNLSNNKSAIDSKLDAITANGSTNICLGLSKASDVLYGAQHHTVSNTLRIVVLLSDGQNYYTGDSFDGHGQPPVACSPNTDPSQSDSHSGENPYNSMCYNAATRQKEMDRKTNELINGPNGLKAKGVEVYVVGFGVCGTPSAALCDTGKIGGDYHDNTANRNLLKCLASSSAGTNDHYFEATSASQLPGIFNNIARLIGFRLVQ